MRSLAYCIASGFYSGLAPKAPGTVGSVVSIPLWLLICSLNLWADLTLRIVIVLMVVLGGYWATAEVLQQSSNESDPQFVVIDEWAGMFITFAALSGPTLLGTLAALSLFRLFDIFKPGPIAQAEKLPGALGVMADDCLAGAAAFVLLLVLQLVLGNR
jgi:phosphatidylglycerophosphatase A